MTTMKRFLLLIFIGFLCGEAFAQQSPKPVYVIVHGAWGGGWAFKEVDSLLTESGNMVYRPTLTGQGERVHLAGENVGLNTHILDVVNTILYEDLNDVVLVGHSYGGMVITGVADSIPDRISKLIYLDALLPHDQESLISIFNTDVSKMEIVNGGIIPRWVSKNQLPPSDVPHPLKTWQDRIHLKNPDRLTLNTSYILTVDKGKQPVDDDFASQTERARQLGWMV